ncbi:TPA: CRISPR-associated protein Cas4 [Mannheimia haemolytica]|uniref:CRISPR-associated exonuclease Cas4 n=1 Tax=Mannheimia haemolytica TaxID=75985 RepID=A0A378NGJ0_MANHA|nr:CRISPR-associated protein Cas4 [Mannheimia haemolytica]AGQ37967.1 CRISPR-associated protein Cas4 [Mannheimia haemolytica D171]AJE08396.1 CRISPR-associated protein Cas4 [Mannheimia haemolytica USDA-ARS-USMARC-184]EEY11083.1 putative RecB family exonuclease [Mannheimia haemolytica serotype A2 str. OVINE]KIX30853.1 CRISPR-associated protein Cas4 [Mannheimia haemolytica]KYL11610.1 CRISPR-associated protein Cas4 [Mannheimia haemolytica]
MDDLQNSTEILPLVQPKFGYDKRSISLSALQHYAFCPRQCALIHNEQVWAENYLTAQGQVLHERVDSGEPETRKGIRFERTVHVAAEKLGISGILDLVERDLKTGELKPVEYKRGKPKPEPMDEIQLCAQALCLEEMTGQTINEGALWYMQTRHRLPITFSTELRTKTLATISEVRSLLNSGTTPLPKYSKRCKACSLIDLCQPQLLDRDRSERYVEEIFK